MDTEAARDAALGRTGIARRAPSSAHGITTATRLSRAAKRALDLAVAASGLVAGAPLLALIWLAVRLDSPGPGLLRQDRIGRHGRVFRMYKFRSMYVGAPVVLNPDGSTKSGVDDRRVTRIGRHLRGGLDELPQLVNVLRGDMSMVGPRPEMSSQAHLYAPDERRKLDVRPGITSLAAVVGRNGIPWRERIAIDLRYLERWSLRLDLRIMLQTLCLPLGIRLFTFRDILDEHRR